MADATIVPGAIEEIKGWGIPLLLKSHKKGFREGKGLEWLQWHRLPRLSAANCRLCHHLRTLPVLPVVVPLVVPVPGELECCHLLRI